MSMLCSISLIVPLFSRESFFEREVVWLKRVGCAHPLEPHHLPFFFLGGEWQLLIS